MSVMLAFGTSLVFHFPQITLVRNYYQQQTKLKKESLHKFENDAVSIKCAADTSQSADQHHHASTAKG